jgi:hypothetical protein
LRWPIFRSVAGRRTSEDLFANDTLTMCSVNPRRISNSPVDTRGHLLPRRFVCGTRASKRRVRSSGLATRDSVKLSLAWTSTATLPATFLGLQTIVLDNLFQDRTMIREAPSMAVHARLGQPAMRVLLRLFGTAAPGSTPSSRALMSRLSRGCSGDDGYLFEYQWQQPFYGSPLGAAFDIYRTLFEAKTHDLAPDDELYGPIRALFDTANLPDDIATREGLDRYVDLEQLVTTLALDTLLGEEDGLAGLHGMNNFYLYRDAGSTRHSFIPWDRDRAFNLLTSSIVDRVYENALTRAALSYGDLFDRYLRTLEDGARMLSDGGWLSAEIERLQALVGQAVYADTRKPYSNEDLTALRLLRAGAERPARAFRSGRLPRCATNPHPVVSERM